MRNIKKLIKNLDRVLKENLNESLEEFGLRIGDTVNVLETSEFGNTGKILSFDEESNIVSLEVGAEARQIEVDIYDVESLD